MPSHPESAQIRIRSATVDDAPLILQLIRELSVYEKLEHEMVATEESLREHLFGARPAAEVVIGEWRGKAVGFALFFQNFSTFLGRPGLYLEDLFVQPGAREKGVGAALLRHLAKLAVQRGCGRFEWSVLDWNQPAIDFYKRLGARPMDEWTVYRVAGKSLTELASNQP